MLELSLLNNMYKRVLLTLCVFSLLSFSAIAEQTWTVNFKDSDLQEVIKFVADITGKTVVIDPQVKGRVKVISAEPVTKEQLYSLFLSVLEVHGFTALDVNGVVRVIPIKASRTSSLPVLGAQGLDAQVVDAAEQITRVIQLNNVAAVKLLPIIRPLIPQHAHLATYAPSNAIIISGSAANIERVEALLDRLDKAAIATTELVSLKHAQAEAVVSILAKLEGRDNAKGAATSQLVMVADKRTNGILISGDDLQRDRVKQLIRRLDKLQPQSGNVRVVYLEYGRAEQVAQVLSNVLNNMSKLEADGSAVSAATVEADEDTNALLITAGPEALKSLLAVVERLDIRRAQVLVEAIIVDMRNTAGRNLGIQWIYNNKDRGFGSSSNGDGLLGGGATLLTDSDSSDLLGTLAGTVGETIGIGRIGGSTDFLAIFNALQQDVNSNILSTPNLLTMDNHAASITVGENVPFVTGSYSATGSGSNNPTNPFQTISRENVGITLNVTPRINEGSRVILDIEQTVSSISESEVASDVITNERKITTQIMVADGETVVLGGLISDDVQVSERRVPLLGSIPVLGRLFRSENNTIVKKNLMVFIRASIIRDDETLTGATAEKYEYIRNQQAGFNDIDSLMSDKADLPILPTWAEAQKASLLDSEVIQLPAHQRIPDFERLQP